MESDLWHQLLAAMLRIRRLEEHVIHFANEQPGLMRGNTHVYIGQEAAGVGACAALRAHDYVFTTHRNHGHVVAKGGDPGRVLAEILGRRDGYCEGRAGTFHVAVPELGILHTSAIVGGSLPLAAGAALASKMRKDGRVTVAFFGDGAMEEGAFYEALNMARLWELPIIFFLENNAYSDVPVAASRVGSNHSSTELADVAEALNIPCTTVAGSDVEAIYQLMEGLVARVREGQGPFFVESRTWEWPGGTSMHLTLPAGDTDLTWAWSPESVAEVLRRWETTSDPILLFVNRLLLSNRATRDEIETLDREVAQEINLAADFALNSPAPPADSALAFTYGEETRA